MTVRTVTKINELFMSFLNYTPVSKKKIVRIVVETYIINHIDFHKYLVSLSFNNAYICYIVQIPDEKYTEIKQLSELVML